MGRADPSLSPGSHSGLGRGLGSQEGRAARPSSRGLGTKAEAPGLWRCPVQGPRPPLPWAAVVTEPANLMPGGVGQARPEPGVTFHVGGWGCVVGVEAARDPRLVTPLRLSTGSPSPYLTLLFIAVIY